MFKSLRKAIKSQDESYVLLKVKPIDLRSMTMYAMGELAKPIVMIDGDAVRDYTSNGPLTQERVSAARDFEVRDGSVPVLGFHGDPSQMWVNNSYRGIAVFCQSQRWLEM
jgi:hypothetical protein